MGNVTLQVAREAKGLFQEGANDVTISDILGISTTTVGRLRKARFGLATYRHNKHIENQKMRKDVRPLGQRRADITDPNHPVYVHGWTTKTGKVVPDHTRKLRGQKLARRVLRRRETKQTAAPFTTPVAYSRSFLGRTYFYAVIAGFICKSQHEDGPWIELPQA